MESTIERHKELLIERMDPDFGLLDKLFANGSLQKREFDNIKLAPSTVQDRCERLLKYIVEKHVFDELLSALKSTNQVHLVNYISADGDYKSEFNEDWPLGENEMKRMIVNRDKLIEIIDHDLCVYLLSKEVINTRQHDFILCKSSKSEKNVALLEVMYRFSVRQFWICVSCLRESNQGHVAEILSQSGVVVGVHANLQGSLPNVDERDKTIVSEITNILQARGVSPEECNRIVSLVQLGLLTARIGNSVLLYFHCLTCDELQRLVGRMVDGSLKGIVEQVFTQLLHSDATIAVSLTWSEGDFERSSLYFSKKDSKNPSGHNLEQKLQEMDLEKQDLLMAKKELERRLVIKEDERRSEKDTKDPIRRNMEQKLQEMELEKQDLLMIQEELKWRLVIKEDERRSETAATEQQRLEFQQQKRAWAIERENLLKYQKDYEKRRMQAEKSADCRLIQTITTKVAKEKRKPITGMTILDQQLYIVNDRSPVIEVYDVKKFHFKSPIKLKPLVEPRDIASGSRQQNLYIFDYKGKDKPKDIICVDKDGNNALTWSTGEDHGCLSVTDESNIILTVFWEKKLSEYTPNGQLIREIKLPESLNHPRHSLKLKNGNFVVCFGQRVSILNSKGNIKKSFASKTESSELAYLVLLTDGSVMVADEIVNSSSVILLNSNLEYKEELLSKEEHRLNAPCRICPDLLNGQLFRLLVVDNNVDIPQVQVFQVKK